MTTKEVPPNATAPALGASRLPAEADQTMALVGARIRALRSSQGLTLKHVAERTGVSVSMLSMLERGVTTASIGTLVSVASALGIHMSDLFDRPDPEDAHPVLRREDQPRVQTSEGAVRRVAHHDAQSGVELAVNEYLPGGASNATPTHHEGREFGVLVSGLLRVELDGESHQLRPGDAIAYSSTRPHRISNGGDEVAVAVWVNIDKS